MTDAPVLDHIGLSISDFARAKSFYTAALAPLGIKVLMEFDKATTGNVDVAGFGRSKPDFWIAANGPSTPLHIAFGSPTRALVDAFYAAAIAAGGKDNGAPGLRPHYHENYYGAFVIDPDGHNVEAVCHAAE